jgi:hypothetical protein
MQRLPVSGIAVTASINTSAMPVIIEVFKQPMYNTLYIPSWFIGMVYPFESIILFPVTVLCAYLFNGLVIYEMRTSIWKFSQSL